MDQNEAALQVWLQMAVYYSAQVSIEHADWLVRCSCSGILQVSICHFFSLESEL